MSARASAPVVGVLVVLGVTVLLGASVAIMVGGLSMPSDPPETRFTGTYDPDLRELAIRHDGGDPIPIDAVDLRVSVDGDPLRYQPPVPFFAARGFGSGPTGPFNPASDDTWAAGDEGTVQIAGTNAPVPSVGDRITVAILVDGDLVATLELEAG